MTVVSNTSPLTNLAAIGQFNLLRRLYGAVHIAEAVWQELNAGDKHWPGRNEVATANWIRRCRASNRHLVTELASDLDQGEAETIALALELNATLVLLDEKDGRRKAERFKLRPVGVVGILLAAKAEGGISCVRPHLDALRRVAGFYLGERLYQEALDLAEETRGSPAS